jgi:regulator of protease activity HflC (stomatin/prohibitin superfamily)
MIGDLLQKFVEFLREFWPIYICNEWERAVILRGGTFWKVVGPGVHFVVPFFWSFRPESTVRTTYVTGLQTIDTKDSGTLTFSASVQLEVVDLKLAMLTVNEYDKTALEDIGALLSDTLMRATPEMLEPDRRSDLLAKCRKKIDAEVGAYGLRVLTLRFNNYMRNMRVYRLFNDQIYTSSS